MELSTSSDYYFYLFLLWGTNISLNILGIIKKLFPKTKNFDRPIDFGLTYKGGRLLGESTTVIGIIICGLLSMIVYYFLRNPVLTSIPVLVYFGHALGSFIKRRAHKKDGEFMILVDHGDYTVFTGTIFILLGYISIRIAIATIMITYVVHPLICQLAYKLNLRERPY